MRALALLVPAVLAPAAFAGDRSLPGHIAKQVLHEPFPISATLGVRHVAVGDVDGDGDLDGYGSRLDGDVLLLGDGDGVFTAAPGSLPPSAVGSNQALLVDVDNDGDLDIAAAHNSFADPQDRLYLNDGSGSFSAASGQMPQDPFRTEFLVAGDIDGNGSVDLWAAKLFFADALLLGDGAGNFSLGAGVALVPAVTTIVVDLADIDADGDLDVLWVGDCSAVPPLLLLENDGTGAFHEVTGQLPVAVAEGIQRASFVDMEGDGDADVWLRAAGCVSGVQQNSFWENDGSGVFAEVAASVFETASGVAAHALIDVDDDADVDLVLATQWLYGYPYVVLAEGGLRIWLNDGAGGLSELEDAFLDTQISSTTFAPGDFDGDRDVDLWSARDLFLGDGHGYFRDAGGTFPREGNGDRPVADVDADGWPDVFAADAVLWRGDGTPFFTADHRALPETPYATYDAAFGDVDGDGDQDLLVVNRVDGDDPTLPGWVEQDDYLWLNDGTGQFTDVTETNLPRTLGDDRGVNLEALLVDLDGDRDLDVVQAAVNDYDGGGGGIDFWLNDGTGVFTEAALADVFLYEAEALVVGDVDGDDDVDVVVGEWPFTVRLLLNDGAGHLVNSPDRIPAVGLGSTTFLDLGDVDGDGDPDIVVGRAKYSSEFEDVFGIWLNDGAGVFVDSAHPFHAAHSLRLFDLDGDADLDLVTDSIWLANDGAGVFTTGLGVPPFESSRATYVDYDMDGDVDVLDARHAVSDLTQHLAWRALPGVGKPLTMDLYGPAGGSYLLFASGARMERAIPTPFGGLVIEPGAILDVARGSLDAEGRGAVDYFVPPNPAFVGATIWWQGIVGRPLRFTNLEPTTMTSF